MESQIFFSTWSKSTGWTTRSAVPGALTQATPALAAFKGVVYMAWKGQSDNNIWFCQYGKNGWGKTSQLPNFQTSTGPALGVGDTGYLHMAWKGAGDTDIRTAHLTAGTAWSPQAPGKGWSSQTQIPVIATSMSPALASQFSASTDILLAWAGAVAEISHHVYVGPLDTLESKQSQTYVFSIGRVNVVTQRSPDTRRIRYRLSDPLCGGGVKARRCEYGFSWGSHLWRRV